MIWFFRILICLAMIPVQTIVLEWFRIFGVKPDLALVIVFVQGWFWGTPSGLYWGLALGGLLDLFSGGALGLGLLLKGVAGAIAGLFGKSFLHLSTQVHVAIFLIISLLHDVAGMLILHGFNAESLQSEEMIIRALYNGILSIAGLFLVNSRTNKQEIQSYGGTIFSPGKK